MEIPGYQPFYIASTEALRAEIDRLGLAIPLDEDFSPLAQPLRIGQTQIPNRFCAQPIAGGDATPDGAPGDLTRRRYRRYAEGRFGLIWVERTIAGPTQKPGQLGLHAETLAGFTAMVREIHAAAAAPPVAGHDCSDGGQTAIPTGLNHSAQGCATKERYPGLPKKTRPTLKELIPSHPAPHSITPPVVILQLASENTEALIIAALLAAEAGFDGVDLQCPREALPDALAAVHQRAPTLLLATRLCVYDAIRGGFGVSADDYRKPDLTEPIRLVRQLHANGLALLNVTAASPSLRGAERAVRGRSDSETPDEHPLMTLDRQLSLARALRAAVPDLPIVGSGFSWLRQFVPHVAAGALRDGMIDFAGLGRGALAYPAMPAEIFARGRVEPGSTCMVCLACSQLRAEGEAVGCVLRDPETYGPIYRQMRRFDADQLLAGASRCHLCEAAPCVAASPTRVDIPAFIQAFRQGDESRAYEILRMHDPLPELTSRFAPGWLESEGACIETTLTGTPVPILDLQYAISWRARDRGQTGVRVPSEANGRPIAIVGAGPAGLAATVRFIELGYTVDLYEQSDQLGGVPQRLLSSHRHLHPQTEIEAILQPALAAARLHLHFGVTLGEDLAPRRPARGSRRRAPRHGTLAGALAGPGPRRPRRAPLPRILHSRHARPSGDPGRRRRRHGCRTRRAKARRKGNLHHLRRPALRDALAPPGKLVRHSGSPRP